MTVIAVVVFFDMAILFEGTEKRTSKLVKSMSKSVLAKGSFNF